MYMSPESPLLAKTNYQYHTNILRQIFICWDVLFTRQTFAYNEALHNNLLVYQTNNNALQIQHNIS